MNDETLANRVDVLVQGKTRFLRFIERRVGSRADAEDVLQAAFLRLVSQKDSLRDEEKLVPWFYQLLRNLVVDHYPHRDALARLESSVAAEAEATTAGADEALFEAVCACVNDLIPALKTEQAELLWAGWAGTWLSKLSKNAGAWSTTIAARNERVPWPEKGWWQRRLWRSRSAS